MIDSTQRREQRAPLNDETRARRRSSARRRRRVSSSDAVIAAYIHDLRQGLAPAKAPRPAPVAQE
jgi:hypothetical protein